MYTLIRTHVRKYRQWLPIDSSQMTLQSLKDNFSSIRIYLTRDDDTDILLIELETLYTVLHPSDLGQTVTNWLNFITDMMITQTVYPSTLDKVGAMVCTDIWDLPVTIEMSHSDYGPGTDIPIGLNNDIVIASKEGDPNYITRLVETSVFSANGRILPHVKVGERLFVKNARPYLSEDRFANYNISVIDFSELGNISHVTLNSTNVTKIEQNETDRLRRQTRIIVDMSMNLTNETALLVLDGYPHFLDSTLSAYDASKVVITIDHRLAVRRLLEEAPELWAGVEAVNVRNGGLVIDSFDALTYAISGLTQIILINNNDVNIERQLVGRTDIIGVYTHPYPPKGLLLLENGDMANYHLDGYDGAQASLSIAHGQRQIYLHDTVDTSKTQIASSTRVQTKTPEAMTGYLIDIYTTKPVL